jgi:hypothetical protein
MAVWKKIIVSGSDADLNNITSTGNISSSGLLFVSTSDATTNPYLTVLIDTSSGRLYYTGSYGGGSGGGVSNFTELTNIPSDLYSSSLQTLGNITSSGNISASGTGPHYFSGSVQLDVGEKTITLGSISNEGVHADISTDAGSLFLQMNGGNLVQFGADALPSSTTNFDLGSPTRLWDNLYVNNISASGTFTISTGSLEKIVLGKGNIDSSLTNAKLSIHSSENNETLFSLKNLTNILFDIDATGKIRHDVNDVPFSFGENQQVSLGFSNTSKAFQIVNGEIINENLLFSVSQSGEVTIGNINDPTLLKVAGVVSASSISASGIIQATTFVGDGSNLTGLANVDALNEFTSSIQSEVNGLKLSTSSYAVLNENNSFNQITASGNISASGIIIGSNLTGSNTGDQDLTPYLISSLTSSFITTGSNVLLNDITASGNISASELKINQISASSLTASNILINEDLNLDGNFIFQGVQFTEAEAVQFTGSTTFGSGSNNTHTFTGSIIGSGSSFNFIGNTFRFNSDSFVQSSETSSLLKTSSFQELLDATGSFIITGSDQHVLLGDITSSGNISASGDLVLSGTASLNKLIVSTLPDGPLDSTYTNAKLSIHSEVGDLFSLFKGTNTHDRLFNISSSGEVSASGNIITKNLILDKFNDAKISFKDINGDTDTNTFEYNKWKASASADIIIENTAGGILLSSSVTASSNVEVDGIVITKQLQAYSNGDNGHLRDIIAFSHSLNLLKLGDSANDTILRGSTTTIKSHITASGNLSASGFLYISASDSDGLPHHQVLMNTSSGQLYYTTSLVGGAGGVSYNATQENGNNINLSNIVLNNFDPLNLVVGTEGGQLTMTFGEPPEHEILSFFSPSSPDSIAFNRDRFNLENDAYALSITYDLNGTSFSEGIIEEHNEQVLTFESILASDGSGATPAIQINSTNYPNLATGSHNFTATINTVKADGRIASRSIDLDLTLSKNNPGTPTITKTANIFPPEALIGTYIEEGATGSIVYNVNSGDANNWTPLEKNIGDDTGQYTFSNANGGSDSGVYTEATSDVTIDVNPTGYPQTKYIFQNWISPHQIVDGLHVNFNSPVLTRRLATNPNRIIYNRQRSFRYGTGSLGTLGDFNSLGGADYLRDLAIWTQTHGTIEHGKNTKNEIQNISSFNLDGTTADNSGRYFYIVYDKSQGTLNQITNVDTNLNEVDSFSGPHVLDNYHMYISNIRYSSYNFNLTFN